MAQSGHPKRAHECPLSGVKRTSKFKSVTSAFDPNRTSVPSFGGQSVHLFVLYVTRRIASGQSLKVVPFPRSVHVR
jgi:hypothetical protein